MKIRDRFLNVLNFEKPADRLPMMEWAPWWDKTFDRWRSEGLAVEYGESLAHFGLDPLLVVGISPISRTCPAPAYHGAPIISDEASYDAVRKHVLTDGQIENAVNQAKNLKERHERGECAIRVWLDGFFWFPRSLFGIENHMFAFYDYPDLMHRMNKELTEFSLRGLEAVFEIIKPDMVGIAEDMSYNHGPMLSQDTFNEFLAPYYNQVVPYIKSRGIKVMVDSDGDVMPLIPWLRGVGVEGIYPLERQSNVDVDEIRRLYPDFLMLGAFDKRVLNQGRQRIIDEFERLLPAMRSGGFIPSVDHQTPPGVSLEDYRTYLQLFEEYCIKAVK